MCTYVHAVIPTVAFKDVTRYFEDPGNRLVMGLVGLHSGIAHNLRFFGKFDPAFREDGSRDYANDKPQDSMMALLLRLFPSSAGTLASVSEGASNFGKNATVTDVAKILMFAKGVRRVVEKTPALQRDPRNNWGLRKIY